jgi:ABC-type multidrug transport system ATPase subunit
MRTLQQRMQRLQATTGLDSTSAAAVVAILSRLSTDGVTVVLSIHQPRLDIFSMLSHILLLSSEGRMVFSGPASDAQSHFASLGHVSPEDVNIADFLLDVTIRASPEVCALMKLPYVSVWLQLQPHKDIGHCCHHEHKPVHEALAVKTCGSMFVQVN